MGRHPSAALSCQLMVPDGPPLTAPMHQSTSCPSSILPNHLCTCYLLSRSAVFRSPRPLSTKPLPPPDPVVMRRPSIRPISQECSIHVFLVSCLVNLMRLQVHCERPHLPPPALCRGAQSSAHRPCPLDLGGPHGADGHPLSGAVLVIQGSMSDTDANCQCSIVSDHSQHT